MRASAAYHVERIGLRQLVRSICQLRLARLMYYHGPPPGRLRSWELEQQTATNWTDYWIGTVPPRENKTVDMVEQTVLHTSLAQRNLEVGRRQFLQIVGLLDDWIVEVLGVPIT